MTLAALLGLYVLIERAGGNPALGIFTVAVVLGNSSEIEQRLGVLKPHDLDAGVRGVHLQMTFIIKTFFFVFLGAMLGPPWSLVGLGAGLAVLLLATRLPAVWVGTMGGKLTRGERQIAAVALPRGLAAGVLATLPAAAGVPHTEQLPVLVFSAVIGSILLFAVGFPIMRRRLPARVAAAVEAAAAAADTSAAPPTVEHEHEHVHEDGHVHEREQPPPAPPAA